MKPVRIVIFAKAPLAGFAKTRLIPALGQQGAAELAQRLLAQTLHEALISQVGPVELCVTPSAVQAVWETLAISGIVHRTDQGDGDLGERMARAAKRVVDAGESILLIGTDCPQLDAAQLQQAAHALQFADATLVPAFDGGYVLLGLNRFDACVFSGIAWSSSSVATDTMSRMKQLEWRVEILPMLHDIDGPSDLKWLPKTWLTSAGSALQRPWQNGSAS